MKRVILAASLAVALQACAPVGDTAPSYLGMLSADGESGDADTRATQKGETLPELRHVGSNKVLGAMAFQKTTGRAVDPSRLNNGR